MLETFWHGLKWFMLCWLASGCQRTKSTAVKASQRRHHCVATTTTVFTSEFDCSLVCFGPRVAEKYLTAAACCTFQKLVDIYCCSSGNRVSKKVAHMNEFSRLMRQRLGDARMRVTQGGHRETAEEIEVTLPL